MRYSIIFAASIATSVSGHALILSIEGANGVSMPGLTVADGTPRDCTNNICGSQADAGIIRDFEIQFGIASPLGNTQGHGKVNATSVIANFMGTGGAAPVNKRPDGFLGTLGVVPSDDNSLMTPEERRKDYKRQAARLFRDMANGTATDTTPFKIHPNETLNGDMRGQGAENGLPTCDDDGVINLVYHQINEDGAGPLNAAIDGTSGGTDAKAFQQATVIRDIPGTFGITLTTNINYPVQVKMPQGMTCDSEVSGAKNVCIVRVRNAAAAGPFGGSAAFTQSQENRKRAIAYRLRKRIEIGSNKSE